MQIAIISLLYAAFLAEKSAGDTITRRRGVTYASLYNFCPPLKKQISTCLLIFRRTALLSWNTTVRVISYCTQFYFI